MTKDVIHMRGSRGKRRGSALRRFGLIGAVLLPLTAAGGNGAVAQSGAVFEEPNPALFVARDADTTIYLFGTIHFVPCALESDPPVCASGITPTIRDAIAASQEVWLEVDLFAATGDPMLLADEILFDDGVRLSDFVPEEEMQILASTILAETQAQGIAVFPSIEIALASLDLMKPWIVSQMLTELYLLNSDDWANGVDYEVADIADERGIPVFGFETDEEHFAPLAIEPLEYQVAALRAYAVMLRHNISLPAVNLWAISEMWALWSEGQLEGIERLEYELLDTVHDAEIAAFVGVTEADFARMVAEYEAFFPRAMQEAQLADVNERLVEQRNLNWMADIEGMLDRPGTFFIAVGAAHMIGDLGLPALLEDAGATVERVQ